MAPCLPMSSPSPSPSSSPLAIEATGLVKRYGDKTALGGVDLDVPRGSVCGLLGPNGAGKTTAVRVLATLTEPDEGSARVAGHDVVADPVAVRRSIGLAAQDATVDGLLTGRENLVMIGELHHLGRRRAKVRADELLEQFTLTDAADRVAKGYSGGMRRRLDLAATLVARPGILFLDEPTTGLDPRARNELWAVLDRLVADGATILLTTQYLDEADQLADRITVVDLGEVIAEGTSDQLKDRIGGEVLEIDVEDSSETKRAADALQGLGTGEPNVNVDEGRIRLPVGTEGAAVLRDATRRLDQIQIHLAGFAVHRPTLDDVFMSLTGRAAEDGAEAEADPEGKRRRGRKGTA